MMDVIEISSDSDSDCVVSPQPPFKKRRTTFYREQMKEARGKNRDRTADKERQPGEGKHTRRQQPQATRGGSNVAIVAPSGPAVEEGEQRQRPLDVRNEAFIDSPTRSGSGNTCGTIVWGTIVWGTIVCGTIVCGTIACGTIACGITPLPRG
ncbi:hypothetical protein CRV24_006720 [Beauveria bassiana]|nr:hypothetical protein CRV24_006720 [Beauveria bassiana]